MKHTFIYDLPTRVFHWLLASLFVIAFAIGSTVDDDSILFSYHMIAGMLLCFLVVLRIGWGLVGTQYARFTGFALNPKELLLYFKGVLSGDKRKWLGHNPASSWAAIAMMAIALGLGVTGYLMTTGQGGEDLEDVHELLANGFLIIVLLHLAGLLLHALRHKDALWKSMLSGRKTDTPEESIPVRSHRAVGIVLLLATAGLSSYLLQNFDAKSRDLTAFGSRLHLGEAEGDEDNNERAESRHKPLRTHARHDREDED